MRATQDRLRPTLRFVLVSTLLTSLQGCQAPPTPEPQPATQRLAATAEPATELTSPGMTELHVQALVMAMADDYIAAMSDVVYTHLRQEGSTSRQRWVAAALMKNSVSAALDIGSAANPDTALLDLLVMVTLQRSVFERLWVPQVWPDEAGEAAVVRLRRTEFLLWQEAAAILSDEQQATLRSLIDDWIAQNPGQWVVEFVRFRDFTETRNVSSLVKRERAALLLQSVDRATRAIDETRLFGERALWLITRFPAVVGQQAETTAYRLIDQPEIEELQAQIEAFRSYAERLTVQVEELPVTLEATIKVADERLASQRERTIQVLSEAVAAERELLIAQTFDRFGEERAAFFDDLESRSDALQGILIELQGAITVSTDLANSLRGTVEAIDRVVARFDPEARKSEPLDIEKLRDAVIAAGEAADRISVTLDRADSLLQRADSATPGSEVTRLLDNTVDRAFWRALALIIVFLGGLALLRLRPIARPLRRPPPDAGAGTGPLPTGRS